MLKEPSLLRQGHIIGDRYLINRIIGSGGTSHVYLADDLKLPGKQWAVKECFISSPQLEYQIGEEAKLLTTLNHPRLPRIVDFFPSYEHGSTYLVMDHIDGMTLEKYFISHDRILKRSLILQLTDQILDVLEYLHTHQPVIVFRDLKPSNIMLTPELELCLIDFGIARNYKREQDQDTVKLGTVGFAAPEQYGGGQSDERSDLYGLGALLLYLVTEGARSEWSDGVESYIRSDYSKEDIAVIRKLLQLSPIQRYQSVNEVREALKSQDKLVGHRDKINNSIHDNKNLGTDVIAVMGASRGAGTTHTAICIAHYLARKHNKVAIVELNTQVSSFVRIQEIVDGHIPFQNQRKQCFLVEDVDYYRQCTSSKFVELLDGKYSYVVLDMGWFQDVQAMEEFLRADIPILVGWGSEWRYQDMEKALVHLKQYIQKKWIYCMPLAAMDAVKRLRKHVGTMKAYSLPLHVDPFDMNEEMDHMLTDMLYKYIPNLKRRKRFYLI
ncbi:serine/threonine protein kinase [Paenibacillus sp. CMAA1364]